MALFYSGVPKVLISSGYLNFYFDIFCRICDNFCKGNVHRRDARGAGVFYSLTPLIEVYPPLCDSVRSVRDNNNQKSSSEEDLSPNLSNRYLRDLMVIPKSLAALCFDPWAVSIAFRI